MSDNVGKVRPPALPLAEADYKKSTFDQIFNAMRLYFNRSSVTINKLIGRHGGVFFDVPNLLAFAPAVQTLGSANVPQELFFEETGVESGIFVEGGGKEIRFLYNGVYRFSVLATLRSASTGLKKANFWFVLNGDPVENSACEVTLRAVDATSLVTFEYSMRVLEGDVVEIFWTGDNTDLSLWGSDGPSSPHPGVPSARVAVQFVSLLPEDMPDP